MTKQDIKRLFAHQSSVITLSLTSTPTQQFMIPVNLGPVCSGIAYDATLDIPRVQHAHSTLLNRPFLFMGYASLAYYTPEHFQALRIAIHLDPRITYLVHYGFHIDILARMCGHAVDILVKSIYDNEPVLLLTHEESK